MVREPLVYIILVNYNGYQYTVDCLESLKNINYSNYKIIVVDNDSKDGSQETFSDYGNVEFIFLKENLGFAGGNNVGIRYAVENNCDYVLLLNNDTVVDKNFLYELVNVAEKDKNVGIVGGKIYYYDNPDIIWYAGALINKFTGRTRHLGDLQKDTLEYNKLSETEYVTGCMMLVRAAALKDVGLMNEGFFLYYEETDWNVRFKRKGYEIMYNPKSIIYHKVSASTSKQSEAVKYYYDRNAYYFIMKNYGFLSRMFMFFYMRIRLLLKYVKNINEPAKRKTVADTYKSIVEGKTGVYNP